MAFRRTLVLYVVLVFMLAGCFRQASDPLEEVESNESTINTGGDDPTPTQETGTQGIEGDDGPTQIPVIVSTPITLVTPTDLPLETATETTFAPAAATDEPTLELDPTDTAVFLTPNAAPATSAVSTLPPAQDPPTATPSGLVTPTDLPQAQPDQVMEDGTCIYIVQSGDNLFRISLQHDKTLAEVVEANPGINAELIQPGDEIIIPGCEDEAAAVDEAVVEPPEVVEPPDSGEQPVETAPEQVIHQVAAGETLGVIARRYGVSQLEIIQANNLTDPNRLSIGQELIIPVEN